MTSASPALCFACDHLIATTDESTGTRTVGRCTAYPGGIPIAIGFAGEDHRRVRGDEVGQIVFDQIEGEAGHIAFDVWQAWRKAMDS